MHNLDNTQNKLLLLFVFDKMEIPLSENTLIDLCCQTNNWITYMDCKQALLQLIDASFIYRINNNPSAEPLYTITPEGRVCLAHFFVRIPSLSTNFSCINRLPAYVIVCV